MSAGKGLKRMRMPVLAVLCVGLCLTLTVVLHLALGQRIDSAREALETQVLLSVLPNELYDNQPLKQPLALVGTDSYVKNAFLATRAGQPSALLFRSEAQGYAGPIELLIGIDLTGRLTGIKVASQQETPSLGGKLMTEPTWLQHFVGASLTQPEESDWALKKDNGGFDQLASATITSRAVVDSLRHTLRYFDEHHAAMVAQPEVRHP